LGFYQVLPLGPTNKRGTVFERSEKYAGLA